MPTPSTSANAAPSHVVTYRFRFEDGEERVFEVHVGRHDQGPSANTSGELTSAKRSEAPRSTTTSLPVWDDATQKLATEPPEWTKLDFHQCDACPLSTETHRHCPPAVDCAAIVDAFASTSSIQLADVVVETLEREIRKRTDMQTAIGSLLGLVMATSGCPILGRFRGLAEFHLPFATPQETLFRSVGTYLLEQYFVHRRGEAPDLDLKHLQSLYETLQQVNTAFVTRVRGAAEKDANLNALVIWFSVAVLVAHSVEDGLDDLAGIFGGEGDSADA